MATYMALHPIEAIEKAIYAAGGRKKLADAVGITRQAVEKWLSGGKIPAERVLLVEKFTKIHRSDLRPDIYPPPRRKV